MTMALRPLLPPASPSLSSSLRHEQPDDTEARFGPIEARPTSSAPDRPHTGSKPRRAGGGRLNRHHGVRPGPPRGRRIENRRGAAAWRRPPAAERRRIVHRAKKRAAQRRAALACAIAMSWDGITPRPLREDADAAAMILDLEKKGSEPRRNARHGVCRRKPDNGRTPTDCR